MSIKLIKSVHLTGTRRAVGELMTLTDAQEAVQVAAGNAVYTTTSTPTIRVRATRAIPFRPALYIGAVQPVSTITTNSVTLGATWHLGFVAPTGYSRVRIHMPNIGATTPVFKAAVAASDARTAVNDLARPMVAGTITDTGWSILTWGGAGTVTLTTTQSSVRPAWNTSDWTTIASKPRVDTVDAPPLALLRMYTNSTNGIGYFLGYIARLAAMNQGTPTQAQWVGSRSLDCIATPSSFSGYAVADAMLTPMVEFTYTEPVFTVMIAGDSVTAGASATGLVGGLEKAAHSLAQTNIGVINGGCSGYTSVQYSNRLLDALALVTPSVVIYEIMSYNDNAAYTTNIANQLVVDKACLNAVINKCFDKKVPLILLSAFPWKVHSTAANTTFQSAMTTMLNYALSKVTALSVNAPDSDVFVADLTPMHKVGVLGNWMQGYSDDGTGAHPNDRGMYILQSIVQPLLASAKAQYIAA